MPIFGKNAVDDASLFTGGRAEGVTLHADLDVEGTITATGSLIPTGGIDLTYGDKIRGYNVAGTTLIDLLYNGASNKTHLNGSTEIDLDVNGTLQASLTASLLTIPNASLTLTAGDITLTAGKVTFSAVGKGITLKAGSNAKAGTFTANGTTPVTVSTTAFIAGSTVAISLKTVGGTVGAIPHLATVTAGTGFTVVGTASDTSVYNWAIIDQA